MKLGSLLSVRCRHCSMKSSNIGGHTSLSTALVIIVKQQLVICCFVGYILQSCLKFLQIEMHMLKIITFNNWPTPLYLFTPFIPCVTVLLSGRVTMVNKCLGVYLFSNCDIDDDNFF